MKTLKDKLLYSEELVSKINYGLKKIVRLQNEGSYSKNECRSTMDDIVDLEEHFRNMIESMKRTE